MVPSRFWYSLGKVPNTFNATSLGLYSSWKCRKIWPSCIQTNTYGYKVIVGPVWKLGYFVLWHNLTLIPPYVPPHKIPITVPQLMQLVKVPIKFLQLWRGGIHLCVIALGSRHSVHTAHIPIWIRKFTCEMFLNWGWRKDTTDFESWTKLSLALSKPCSWLRGRIRHWAALLKVNFHV